MTAIFANLLETLVRDGNEEMAVRVANIWGDTGRFITDVEPLSSDRYAAACELALETQTVFPCCLQCRWPVVPGDPHVDCEKMLGDEYAGFIAPYVPATVSHWAADEEEELPSLSMVHARARRALGNTELADEAARMYPGDFI